MLQYILLFLEIVLLAAIGYIYWRTRVVVASLSILPLQTPATAEPLQNQVEMMREAATLMTEWDTITSTIRADLDSQQAELKETLKQAEATTTKLQELVLQAETLKVKQVAHQPVHHSLVPNLDGLRCHSEGTIPATLKEAIKAFGEYLRANHYGESTITRTVNHLQKFAAWLGGQAEVEPSLRPIVLAEIELYRRRLEAQQTPTDMVEREVAALKMFANWINTVSNNINAAEPYRTPNPATSPQPGQLLAPTAFVQSFERYHAVFALAQQGVAPAIITAQTGLEREAVHLLLTMGPPSLVKN